MTQEFISAFVLIILAAVLALMGAIIFALPLGLIGGYFLIKEMIRQFRQ